ncbi:MAG: hypothetical protein WCO44_11460 [Bacteroidota bacterium]
METVKRIGIIALLTVFLFGITGISVFHHACTSSNKEQVTVYAEIYRQAPVSCCEGEAFEPFRGHRDGMQQYLSAVPCCKSTNTFLALHIITERINALKLQQSAPLEKNTLVLLQEAIPENPARLQTIRFQFHSPPLYGTELIHYLHQIKIPALPAVA